MEAIDRFTAKVDYASSECWLWTGFISEWGYGLFRFEGRMLGAHRFSYAHYKGPLIKGMVIDHLCHVRHCCNPDHLEQITKAQNNLRVLPRKSESSYCREVGCEGEVVAKDRCQKHYDKYKRSDQFERVLLRGSEEERFWSKVNKTDGCWLWTAGVDKSGYGRFTGGYLAHRWSYEKEIGLIPKDAVIDHLCHVRACVNPQHLEAVSRGANSTRRAKANLNSATGVRGVSYNPANKKTPWTASVGINYKQYHERYATKGEAEEAVRRMRRQYHSPPQPS